MALRYLKQVNLFFGPSQFHTTEFLLFPTSFLFSNSSTCFNTSKFSSMARSGRSRAPPPPPTFPIYSAFEYLYELQGQISIQSLCLV